MKMSKLKVFFQFQTVKSGKIPCGNEAHRLLFFCCKWMDSNKNGFSFQYSVKLKNHQWEMKTAKAFVPKR